MDDSLVEESPEFEIISDENEMNLFSFREHQDGSLGTNYLSVHWLFIRTLFTFEHCLHLRCLVQTQTKDDGKYE